MGPMRPSKRATKTALATLGWSALWLVLLVLCRLAIPEVEPPWLERAVYFGVPSLIVALTWWLLGREERETARIAKRLAAIATHSGWWIVPAAGTPTEPVICLEPGLFNALESESRIMSDIYYLTSDELEGRGSTTEGIHKAAAYIAEKGLIVENRHGDRVPNPMVRVERDALTELRLTLSQLGLTPAARARLGAQGVEGRSAVDELPGLASAAKLRILVGGKDSPA